MDLRTVTVGSAASSLGGTTARTQRQRAARDALQGRLEAALARVKELEARLVACSQDQPEVEKRLHVVRPILKAELRAYAAGRPAEVDDSARPLRNVALQNFAHSMRNMENMSRRSVKGAEASGACGALGRCRP